MCLCTGRHLMNPVRAHALGANLRSHVDAPMHPCTHVHAHMIHVWGRMYSKHMHAEPSQRVCTRKPMCVYSRRTLMRTCTCTHSMQLACAFHAIGMRIPCSWHLLLSGISSVRDAAK